jgi:peroxiredoxin
MVQSRQEATAIMREQPMLSDIASLQRGAEEAWLESWKRGPTRLRWTGVPLQAGDTAPDLGLHSAEGKTVQLRDLWRAGTALLLYRRHYGCSCGRDRAKRLRAEYGSYVRLGARVVVIGQADPARSMSYAQQQELPCPVLCDPMRRAYEAYGLLEGQPAQVVFDAPDAFLRRDYEAGRQLQQSRLGTPAAPVDSPWQLPGEFVVDGAGIVRLAHRYQHCEDWPDSRVLIAAIKDARGLGIDAP